MYQENPKNTPAPKGAFPGTGSGTADFYTQLQKQEPAPGKVLGGGKLGVGLLQEVPSLRGLFSVSEQKNRTAAFRGMPGFLLFNRICQT